MRRMSLLLAFLFPLACLTLLSCTRRTSGPAVMSDADYVARGRYLTSVGACNDCHTPGNLWGAPDTTRILSGSELGWKGPWGVSYARNLTPEPQTGIGAWSESDIVTAIRTGKRPDGTMLLPPMPWTDYAFLTDEDAKSIAKYLKSVPPVMHKVPDKLPPGAKATGSIIEVPGPSAWDAPRTAPSTAGGGATP